MTVETGSDDLITRVVAEIARYRGIDPLDLDTPLATAVDTDALHTLFGTRPDGRARGPGRITFAYEDLTVTVDSSGDVDVAAAAEPAFTTRSGRTST